MKAEVNMGMKSWSAALALAAALARGLPEFLRLQGWRLRSRVLR